jgi:outer membrane lipoprotein-sorting protein
MRPIPLVLIWVLSSVLAASFSSTGTADEPKQDVLTAKQILERMAKTYAELKSYRDSGLVKTVFIWTGGKRTVEKPFTTAFVRPDHFRFEFKGRTGVNQECFEYEEKEGDNQEYRYIVWRKGKEVQTWWDVTPGIEKPESLSSGLARATGVSSSSAHTVPALLLPDEVGRLFKHMTEAKRIEDAKLGNVECFRIEGKYAGRPRTLWVDKKAFLVRRIDAQYKYDNCRVEQTTTYDPVIDKEITEKLLEFNPPNQK